MKKLRIKQTKSINDTLKNHKLTIKALGLGRPNYVVEHNDTAAIRGMFGILSK
jgi:large subunit ribosomal protein L30